MTIDTPPVAHAAVTHVSPARYYSDAVPGLKPVALVATVGDTEQWLFDVSITSTAHRFLFPEETAGPPVLEVFVAAHDLSEPLAVAQSTAREVFGDAVAAEYSLESDPDLGGDYVSLVFRVPGLTREQFRVMRREFFDRIARAPQLAAMRRLVLDVERSAAPV